MGPELQKEIGNTFPTNLLTPPEMPSSGVADMHVEICADVNWELSDQVHTFTQSWRARTPIGTSGIT